MSKFKIVLFQPEIPGNTGSIGRTCVGLDLELCLIKPYGFELSEKQVRRAGLDYWQYIQLKEFASWEDFLAQEQPPREKLFFFSRFAQQIYYQASFTPASYLIFGRETSGLPNALHQQYADRFFYLPHFNDHIRSFNLANTATAVAFEAVRQIEFPN